MADLVNNNKIFKPFMPSLFHLALVQVSLPLCKEYGIAMLSEILGIPYEKFKTYKEYLQEHSKTSEEDIQENSKTSEEDIQENSKTSEEDIQENLKTSKEDLQENSKERYSQAKEKLLSIPPRLRASVLAAVHGMEFEFIIWRSHHMFIKSMVHGSIALYKDILRWKSDGTIDRVKTAKNIVLNNKFHIRNRFQIACMYCFVNNVQEIWQEMEATGIVGNDYLSCPAIEDVWIKWIRNGTPVHWTEAIIEEDFQQVRFSSFFHLLPPETRQKYLPKIASKYSISGYTHDDAILCLNALTRKEEEEILRTNPQRVIFSFLNWPYNTLFVEIAEKIMNYMSFKDSALTIGSLFDRRHRTHGDYREMFEKFYSMCHDDFKARFRKLPFMSEKIDAFFEEKRLSQGQNKMLH